MSEEASGTPKSRPSFGGTQAPPRDLARADGGKRTIAALTLLWVALLLGVLPNWLVGRGFFEVHGETSAIPYVRVIDSETHSLWRFVTHDPRWAAAAATTLAPPLWYWWWRRSRMAFGAAIGVFLSIAAGAAWWWCVDATNDRLVRWIRDVRLYGTYPTLYASAVAFAAAFVVAPPPRDGEEISPLALRALLRRQRKAEDA